MPVHYNRLDTVVRAGGGARCADEDAAAPNDIYPSSIIAERPVFALFWLTVLLAIAAGIFAGLLQVY